MTWLHHIPLMAFLFAFGGCVGSFINVVIYRLPAGMSVTAPPSRCPTCGARLRFFAENLPVLGWFYVRGRCRYCGVRISPQYFIVEALMAALFLFLYIALYVVPPETAWLGAIGGEWWYERWGVGFFRTWPAFIALSFLIAGLIAMTVIDARTFTIPIEIPLFITITAFLAWPLQALHPQPTQNPLLWPIPATDWHWFAVAAGGMAGVVLSVILLRAGMMRYSFEDYHEYVEHDQVLGEYPHARREMLVEVWFLSPCLAGLLGGWFLGAMLPGGGPPVILQAVGGSFLGYLVGGGIVWGARILFSLIFGREAMGMGDVHLLAAVGAVLGAVDPIWVFFLAPFLGIAWHIAASGAASLRKTGRRELPYGPHLALATMLVIFGRPIFNWLHTIFLPWLPAPGLHP